MQRHQRGSATPIIESDTESEAEAEPMRCISCREEYGPRDAGTCKECYEEVSETEDELKQEIDELKAMVAFLRFSSPLEKPSAPASSYSDIVLVASDEGSGSPPVPVPAHRAILVSRSPVFKAMLENEMEESRSGTIKISDVTHEALRSFVEYLYTAQVRLDDQMACDLLVLAEKYEVEHLKDRCEKFIVSKLSWDNSLMFYAFAHQHRAKLVLDAALSRITDNMDKLTKREEYKELMEKDPRLLVEIYETYLSRQINTAVHKDSSIKS